MLKKLLIIISIILIGAGLLISLKSPNSSVVFDYNYDKSENLAYISSSEDYILLTTMNKLNNKSSLHLIDKKSWKKTSTIQLNEVITEPILTENFIIVATKNLNSGKLSDIQVIDTIGTNLLWKDKLFTTSWYFKVYNDNVLYINKNGILQNVKLSTKDPIWKASFGISFDKSTPPEISNGRFYICNGKQILAIDMQSSQVVYNFKTYNNITSCSFINDKASLLLDNDDILSVDLSKSLILWKYRYVTILSDTILKILNDSYLLLLNSTDYTILKGAKKSRVLNSYHQIFNIIDLKSGQTQWQKSVKYPENIRNLVSHISGNIIIFKNSSGKLLANKVNNGENLWELLPGNLYNNFSTFTLSGNYLFLLMNRSKTSYLGIIDLYTGRLRNRLTLTKCLAPKRAPLIEDDKAYIACKNNKFVVIKFDKSYLKHEKKD